MPMPAPGERVDEREHREEPLPGGGHEAFSREVKSDSGRRATNDGRVADYEFVFARLFLASTVFICSEQKQEISYKRESTR